MRMQAPLYGTTTLPNVAPVKVPLQVVVLAPAVLAIESAVNATTAKAQSAFFMLPSFQV
jgi:hypothetical protein